ncbi:MAG: hypothetical protein K2L72_06135 [Clostridia bacterium]|nr:hypothetical protein [Clostridia bacterium]
MKEYRVNVIVDPFMMDYEEYRKTFQDILNKRAAQGYVLHSFKVNKDAVTAVFEKDILEAAGKYLED